jgi:hypothetical protein
VLFSFNTEEAFSKAKALSEGHTIQGLVQKRKKEPAGHFMPKP